MLSGFDSHVPECAEVASLHLWMLVYFSLWSVSLQNFVSIESDLVWWCGWYAVDC